MTPTQEVELSTVIPADVVAYAAAKGLADSLLPHWEIAKRVFPNARRRKVYLEDDPEIANLKFIVFHVDAPGLPLDQASQARERWLDESLSYPAVVPGCGIVLRLLLGQ